MCLTFDKFMQDFNKDVIFVPNDFGDIMQGFDGLQKVLIHSKLGDSDS